VSRSLAQVPPGGDPRTTARTVGIVAAVAGGALLVTGIVLLVRSRRRGLDGFGRPQLVAETRKGSKMSRLYSGKLPTAERVALIQDLVFKSVKDPDVNRLGLQITHGCPARDKACEARAIDAWTRRNIRYTGDIGAIKLGRNGPVEPIDRYQTARRTIEAGGEDCDGHAALNAALLAVNGIEPRLRVTAETPGGEDGHIYAGALLGGRFVALDTTLPNGRLGVEAPFARFRDFPA
jgi:hypothetical protein